MRYLHPALSLAQRQPSVRPAIMITVGDVAFKTTGTGSTVTCHNTSATELQWTKDEGGRILKVKELESPYKQTADIILSNYDRLLFDLNLKGERLSIAWGATTTEGDLYSTSPVMWVKSQTFYEAQGIMQCELKCIGILDLLNNDTASEKYTDDGTTALGALITSILTSTLGCFDHCKVYNVVTDNALDDLWTGVYLGESFVIQKNETRAHVLARLFDMTHASMKPGNERPDENEHDTIHIFTPSSEVQSEYTLDRASHRFYVDSDSSSVVMPNEIIINTPTGYSPAYSGRARDAVSYSTNPCSKTELVAGLISNNQAQTIANTMLANIINAESGSSALVPMNCGTEIFDRMKIYSKRSGRTLEGAVGSITRFFDPNPKVPRYDMQIGFGKWFDPRALDDSLGYGYGFVDGEDVGVSGDYGHMLIIALSYYANSGYSAYANAGGMYSVVDGAWITFRLNKDAVDCVLKIYAYHQTVGGIMDVYVDDVKIGTIDNYGSTSLVMNSFDITLLTNGIHVIKLLTNGKNASSTGYQQIVTFLSIDDANLVA